MTGATAEQQLAFLRNLQTILDGGQFVASYKFALLLALANISVERAPAADGSLSIPLDQLSERFIEIYWRHAAPFRGSDPLWQSTGSQAAMISAIGRTRSKAGSFAQARRSPHWNPLVRRARKILLAQPLWRLQKVGSQTFTCLYDHKLQADAITLHAGVPACFRALHDTVQALVQLAWLRYVQNLPRNQTAIGPGQDVAAFLFGADRAALVPLRQALADLQKGLCFYCLAPLRGHGEIDHFIPWARYPRDLGHNFVLAHRTCNQSKRDLLADVPHLEKWAARNTTMNEALRELFDRIRLQHEAGTSARVAEWCYSGVEEAGGMVWAGREILLPLRGNWRGALGLAAHAS